MCLHSWPFPKVKANSSTYVITSRSAYVMCVHSLTISIFVLRTFFRWYSICSVHSFLQSNVASETLTTTTLYVVLYLLTLNEIDFIVALNIRGIEDEKTGKAVRILNENLELGGGRLHHLYCSVKRCDPIQTFHLEFLEYQSYEFEVTFKELESVHAKYVISDIKFTFQSINTSFTTLTIWFRFVFLVVSFLITVID